MKLPNWFRIMWWVLLSLTATVFLYFRLPDLIHDRASAFDVVILLVWLGLLLCPIFPEVNLFGLKLKQQIEGLKGLITQQISRLAAEVRTSVNMTVYQAGVQPAPARLPEKTSDPAPPARLPEGTSEELPRSPMEFKILKTLWIKQVNRFDDLSQVWSFRLNANAAEFFGFRDAATTLMKEGLVTETGHGQIFLTPAGFEYCKNHYKDFPDEQWWPEDPMKPERLKAVLGEG